MGKLWLNNEIVDRLAMLQQTEVGHPGVNQVAIEKDWWVTVTLKALFQTDCRDSLIFKGGTSLSKGFNIIERFSEDIDLAINHSFFDIEKTSKSQREKLRKMSRAYIHETLSAQLDVNLKEIGVSGYTIENVSQVQDKEGEWRPIDSDKDPTVILLHYPSILEDTINYIPPRVKIEISCLSMDEPTELRQIHSLIGESFDGEDTDGVASGECGGIPVFRRGTGSRSIAFSRFGYFLETPCRGTDGQRDGIAVAVCHIILITATACKEQGGAKADAGKIFFHEFHYIVLCG